MRNCVHNRCFGRRPRSTVGCQMQVDRTAWQHLGQMLSGAPWKPHLSLPYTQRKITFAALPRARSRGSRGNATEPQTPCISMTSARKCTPCARAAMQDVARHPKDSLSLGSKAPRAERGCSLDAMLAADACRGIKNTLISLTKNHKFSRLAASLSGGERVFSL